MAGSLKSVFSHDGRSSKSVFSHGVRSLQLETRRSGNILGISIRTGFRAQRDCPTTVLHKKKKVPYLTYALPVFRLFF